MKSLRFSLFIFLFAFLHIGAQEDNSGLVVIVNAANKTPFLSKSEVKLIYLRKINKRWSGINKNIIPVDRKGLPEIKKTFLTSLLNMSNQDMSRYFTEREYMNAEMPPVTFSNDEEIIDFVSENVGAIAYVNFSSLNKENKSKVKIVYPDK